MNTQKSSMKTYLIILAIVVIGGAIYFFYQGQTPAVPSLIEDQNADVSANVIALLNQIQSLRIDTTLFTDQSYKSLQDYSVAIPEVPVGRQNPFAPVPGLNLNLGSQGTPKH